MPASSEYVHLKSHLLRHFIAGLASESEEIRIKRDRVGVDYIVGGGGVDNAILVKYVTIQIINVFKNLSCIFRMITL